MSDMITKQIAFFDAEYTADSAKDRGQQEMIQCALLVFDATFSTNKQITSINSQPNLIYQTFVRPTINKRLSEYIRDLTGIKQQQVDDGVSIQEALLDIANILRSLKIKKILTWGPDWKLLKDNCKLIGCCNKDAKRLLRGLDDVSMIISQELGFEHAISQHKACELLDIKEDGRLHDAYDDAMNLYKVLTKMIEKK
mgnify:CR=1 FL=1